MKNLTAWIQVKSSADYFERSPIFINPWQCYQLVWYQIVKVGFSLRWNPDPKEKHWLVDLLPAQAVGLCTPVVTQPTSCKIGFSCPCSAKPGCQSGPCLHWALQDRLLWCAQINQRSPGTAALQSCISSCRSSQPHCCWHDLGGFQRFPRGKVSQWVEVQAEERFPGVLPLLAFIFLNTNHLCPTPLLPLGYFPLPMQPCNP